MGFSDYLEDFQQFVIYFMTNKNVYIKVISAKNSAFEVSLEQWKSTALSEPPK
jgi:hypothetical protein